MAFLTEAANRGSISTGYNIDNSLKFEANNSEYLSFTNSVGENRRTWTYSTWIKKTELFGAGSVGGTLFGAYLSSNDRARIEQYADQLGIHGKISGTTAINVRTNRVLRDTSAWYHCMVVLDTTQSTETDRVKIYINGVQETSMVSAVYPPQNYQFALNNAVNHYVGQKGDGTDYFCGYMAETYFVDGSALVPTDFGEFDDNGIWVPIKYDGAEYPSQDTNHFYLNFEDSSDLGKDSSGNGKNMTSNNITAADQATDTPTNNFAIANPLLTAGGFMRPTEGGTKGVLSTAGPGNNTGGTSLVSTIPVSKGKWYFEAQNTNSGDVYLYLGVGDTGSIDLWGIDGVKLTNQTSSSVGWRGGGANDGKVYGRSAGTNYTSTNPVTWETEVVGLALDLDNGVMYFHKSGTYINSGDPANGTDNGGQYDLVTGVDDQWLMAVSAYNLATWNVNFGGYTTMSISSAETDANGYGTFEYAPPSGYYALCTKNLAEYG